MTIASQNSSLGTITINNQSLNVSETQAFPIQNVSVLNVTQPNQDVKNVSANNTSETTGRNVKENVTAENMIVPSNQTTANSTLDPQLQI